MFGKKHYSLAYFSEVAFDAAFFNETAWRNSIAMVGDATWIRDVFLDGTTTRIDRPEYLSGQLSFWTMSEAEAEAAALAVPNLGQCQRMVAIQRDEILRPRIMELQKFAPHVRITLSIDGDDTQFTTSAVMHEVLLFNRSTIRTSLRDLGQERRSALKEASAHQKELERLEDEHGAGKQRREHRRIMNELNKRLGFIDRRIAREEQEFNFYRAKKVRPEHQYHTARFVREFYASYRKLCLELGVRLVTRPSVIRFGDLVVDYAHSRHSTWAPMPTIGEKLVAGLHGKSRRSLGDVHAILESGHHGVYQNRTVNMTTGDEQLNFGHLGAVDPAVTDEVVKVIVAPPFEDQERIDRWLSGQESERLSAGKPMGTRKHAVCDRNQKDSVSGLPIMTLMDGIVSAQVIEYAQFADGSVNKRDQDEHAVVWCSSDIHLESQQENPTVQGGHQAMIRRNVTEPIIFRGLPAVAKGVVIAGDIAEANSESWKDRESDRRSFEEVFAEYAKELPSLDVNDPAAVLEMVKKIASDAKGGTTESMAMIMRRTADFLETHYDIVGESELQFRLVVIPGNHAHGVLNRLGLDETNFAVERFRARGIPVFEVGLASTHLPQTYAAARVAVGGYSTARSIVLPNYGKTTAGEAVFGPIRFYMQHDPKGSGYMGLVGAARTAGADLALAGHTHETWVVGFRKALNRMGFAFRLSTLQGVTPTEISYAETVPRTPAGHAFIMPKAGDFTEFTFPASYLAKVGRTAQERTVAMAVKKVKRK